MSPSWNVLWFHVVFSYVQTFFNWSDRKDQISNYLEEFIMPVNENSLATHNNLRRKTIIKKYCYLILKWAFLKPVLDMTLQTFHQDPSAKGYYEAKNSSPTLQCFTVFGLQRNVQEQASMLLTASDWLVWTSARRWRHVTEWATNWPWYTLQHAIF